MKTFPLIFLVCLCSSLSNKVHAQFFRTDNQPCTGASVALDTVFYSPDKALPFDHCFYLAFRLPGNPQVDYFSILPIDKSGNKNVRRRDYRVYIRSAVSDASDTSNHGKRREKIRRLKKSQPWVWFKDPKIQNLRNFSDIQKTVGPSNTEFRLKMPPLDPNRLYKLVLLTRDNKVEEKMLTQEGLLLTSAAADKLSMASYRKSRADYNDMNAQRVIPFPLTKYSYEYFANSAYDPADVMKFTDPTSGRIDNILNKRRNRHLYKDYTYQYRFYLSPHGGSVDEARARTLPNDSYVEYTTEKSFNRLAPLLLLAGVRDRQTKDANGNLPDFSHSEDYDVYVMKYITVHTIPGNQSYSDTLFIGKIGNVKWLGDTTTTGSINIDSFSNQLPKNKYGKVGQAYVTLNGLNYLIDSACQSPIPAFDAAMLHMAMTVALQCPCEEKGIKDITQKDDLTRSIAFFADTSNLSNRQLQEGLISLKEPFYRMGAPDSRAARIANIKTSVTQLLALEEFISKLNLAGSRYNTMGALLQYLNLFRLRLESLADWQEKALAIEQERINALGIRYDVYKINTIASGSTSVLDFLSANKFRITPDFGLVTVFKGKGLELQDMSPYLGFHINFRSIDKTIEMKHVRYKSWRHYFSIMAGITLRSLKIEGQRDDFFGNSCLLTGLGFRLNNFFRVTAGTVWFRSIDKNPLSANKPLAFSPFAGLSLDLELQTLFGGINKLFQ